MSDYRSQKNRGVSQASFAKLANKQVNFFDLGLSLFAVVPNEGIRCAESAEVRFKLFRHSVLKRWVKGIQAVEASGLRSNAEKGRTMKLLPVGGQLTANLRNAPWSQPERASRTVRGFA